MTDEQLLAALTQTAYGVHYEALMASPFASDWLKHSLYQADKRDICDALADAEALLGALQAKYTEVVS